ncbi:MAG: hypothetical protein KJP06_10030 [Deltaproteobacteria bacterium]|nr:hypothetical protein [Deltaproteobacteria bacterium]
MPSIHFQRMLRSLFKYGYLLRVSRVNHFGNLVDAAMQFVVGYHRENGRVVLADCSCAIGGRT